MLSHRNNPAIGLATRQWLGQAASTSTILDKPCRILVQKILDKVGDIHPGGLAYSLARELGSSSDRATVVGSICEMFYAACSVTDDLQDGDTDEYLEDIPMPLRINAQVQLVSLIAVRVDDLAKQVEPNFGRELLLDPYRTLAIMLTGQRKEIARDPWDIETYESVARLSAGEQFGTYLRLAAISSDIDAELWVAYGRSFGTLLQIVADAESNDSRLTCFSSATISKLYSKIGQELTEHRYNSTSEFAKIHTEGVIRRCQFLSKT